MNMDAAIRSKNWRGLSFIYRDWKGWGIFTSISCLPVHHAAEMAGATAFKIWSSTGKR